MNMVVCKEGRRRGPFKLPYAKSVLCWGMMQTIQTGESPVTQSERTESGHGGWWGWGKARYWRRFDDRASDDLILFPVPDDFR